MDLNFSAFQEPRGVMRIFQFIFSICAFASLTGYSGFIAFSSETNATIEYSYPFKIVDTATFTLNTNTSCSATIRSDFSSDSRFFVATGVISMLYSLAAILVYAKMDEIYRTNKKLPLYDFLVTVFLAVLWISSSGAWANGLTSLKSVTSNPMFSSPNCIVKFTTGSYSTLNISVIFGFLNFFLWAADLWFLYKETSWFQANNAPPSSNIGI